MKLDVPFYENNGDGKQCMQVAMKIALKHVLGREYSLEELDRLTNRKAGCWTWTTQIVPALYDLGLDVRYFTSSDPKPYLGGEKYLQEKYGAEAENMIAQTDINALVKSIRHLEKYDLVEIRKLTQSEIEEHLRQSRLVLILFNSRIVYPSPGPYNGHFVVLTGFDSDYFYYHESGPNFKEKNKAVKKDILLAAWNSKGTENDAVVVYGPRKKKRERKSIRFINNQK